MKILRISGILIAENEGWTMEKQYLFEKIDLTASYSDAYKAKMKQTYQYFEDAGFVFREHALNRVLGQKSGKDKFFFTKEGLLAVLRSPVNFLQADGKQVRFYHGIAVVTAPDTGEVVSIVIRSRAKGDWKAL